MLYWEIQDFQKYFVDCIEEEGGACIWRYNFVQMYVVI